MAGILLNIARQLNWDIAANCRQLESEILRLGVESLLIDKTVAKVTIEAQTIVDVNDSLTTISSLVMVKS